MAGEHVPVLLREAVEGLDIKPDGIYVDGTLGRGGHSEEIAKRLTTGKLISIDRDQTAIEASSRRLARFADRVTIVKANFRDMGEVLEGQGVGPVDGFLFDLGVSSPQLDDAGRGFSYMVDAPLDMRMDRTSGITACDIVNTWTQEELADIFFRYGEERYSRRIAGAIIARREETPITSTVQLSDIIKSAMPAAALREKQHPAKRCFQALRIAVNDELGALSDVLETAMDRLSTGGRLAVISFHSLEDRIVKNAIRARENGCTCPPGLPVCVCGFVKTMRSVNRKPITPSPEELERNPRARSAKLRVAEKL